MISIPRADAKHELLSVTVSPEGALTVRARSPEGTEYEQRVQLPYFIGTYADPLLAVACLALSAGLCVQGERVPVEPQA